MFKFIFVSALSLFFFNCKHSPSAQKNISVSPFSPSPPSKFALIINLSDDPSLNQRKLDEVFALAVAKENPLCKTEAKDFKTPLKEVQLLTDQLDANQFSLRASAYKKLKELMFSRENQDGQIRSSVKLLINQGAAETKERLTQLLDECENTITYPQCYKWDLKAAEKKPWAQSKIHSPDNLALTDFFYLDQELMNFNPYPHLIPQVEAIALEAKGETEHNPQPQRCKEWNQLLIEYKTKLPQHPSYSGFGGYWDAPNEALFNVVFSDITRFLVMEPGDLECCRNISFFNEIKPYVETRPGMHTVVAGRLRDDAQERFSDFCRETYSGFLKSNEGRPGYSFISEQGDNIEIYTRIVIHSLDQTLNCVAKDPTGESWTLNYTGTTDPH